MRRRAVLRGGIGCVVGAATAIAVPGALAGCGLFSDEPPPPDPLEPLMVAKAAIVAGYAATMTRHTDLTKALTPLRDAHEKHLDKLLALLAPERRKAIRPKVKPSKSADGKEPDSPSGSSAEPTDPSTIPTNPDEAMTALATEEKAASARSAKACLEGASPRAALLGSISAAEATHVAVLQ